MRLKHNKKRNTAFLYEALVRELTKSVIKQNKYKIKEVSKIIREAFKKGSALQKELNIYRPLYEGESPSRSMVEKLLIESKIAHKTLDKSKVFKEQSALINKINRVLSPELYKTFVPNYKSIATVHSIFNADIPPKDKIILEEKIVDYLLSKRDDSNMSLEHIDNIVYKTFVEKFNNKYSDALNENQKTLLKKYISSFSDNGLELKIFLNEEIEGIKENIKNSYTLEEVKGNSSVLSRMQAVEGMVNSLKQERVDDSMIRKIIKIQNLMEEVKNAAENIDRS